MKGASVETLGQRLREERRLAVLTQAELAEKAGVSLITVNRLENEEGESSPRPETVRRLAKALGVDPAWLLFGESEILKSAA